MCLTCTEFSIQVDPVDVDYYLVPQYLDTTTGARYRFIAGPLNGRIVDPFGETEFLLLEAEIRVPGEQSVAVYLPRKCLTGGTASY